MSISDPVAVPAAIVAPAAERPAIAVKSVRKRFRVYANPVTGPIKDLLCFWNRGAYGRDFVAVNDVSFEVARGEVVGIIGSNGAGKSTLLKMISGLLPVDGGTIEVNGRITALMAVGVGVDPEFTGSENILFGGLMLGMSRAEVLAKMPSIIEFAELGEHIDQPFRTLSSGMRARLLFSISMSIDPDILIVDEALATGDSYFVQKCMRRIEEMRRNGATILYVSHSLDQIMRFCERVILMADGKIVASGDPVDIVKTYHRLQFERFSDGVKEIQKKSETALRSIRGDETVQIEYVRLLNAAGEEVTAVHTGERLDIALGYTRNDPSVEEAHFFVGFLNQDTGAWIGNADTYFHIDGAGKARSTPIALADKGEVRMVIEPLLLVNNYYCLWVMANSADGRNVAICEYKGVAPFFVSRPTDTSRGGAFFTHPIAEIASGPFRESQSHATQSRKFV
jgi:ABC-type polysaccharide/polyol phosphate transport system ATPase subunit